MEKFKLLVVTRNLAAHGGIHHTVEEFDTQREADTACNIINRWESKLQYTTAKPLYVPVHRED